MFRVVVVADPDSSAPSKRGTKIMFIELNQYCPGGGGGRGEVKIREPSKVFKKLLYRESDL